MFCGSRTEAQEINETIDKQLKAEGLKAQDVVQLLLLGTGESGKSTVVKQMKIMHMNGFSNAERDMYRNIIHCNIVEALATLVEMANVFGLAINPHLQSTAAMLRDTSDISQFLGPEVASKILSLWKDPAIQKTFERRAEFQLPGSVDYLMNRADKLLHPGVEVTDTAILHARMRTRGIVEMTFEIERTEFKLLDVGGQRSERRKWIQCFSSVTAVIFCIALSEYDEKLFEDNTVGRLTEAIQLFGEICNNKFFNDPKKPTTMIIFLNKKDIFEEKLKREPLENYFPDYKGGADHVEGAKFILEKLTSQSKNSKQMFFPHVTCATDTENIRVVFNAVKTSILTRFLEDAKML